MLIARQKRKENIIEYIIYMFQVEDLVRAFNFNINELEKSIISQYQGDYGTKREIREWYRSILTMLKENNLEKSGHIPVLDNLINNLNDIHLSMLNDSSDREYKDLYNISASAIEELKIKSGDIKKNDVGTCLNGLYGLLILKIQQKKINPETEKAFENISKLMAILGQRFHEIDEGVVDPKV